MTTTETAGAILDVQDSARVRTLTLNRPAALNAFNEALYDAGTDLAEMAEMVSNPEFVRGTHGFLGLVDALAAFPKPLVLAVNGLGLGIGATIIGFGDLVLMSTQARLKRPFTSLGVAPEAASSYLPPRLVGHQNAAWMLMSSEWIPAEEAQRMGLVWRVCEPDELLAQARQHAETLAARPISSLKAVKGTMTAPLKEAIAAARARENQCFADLMGGPANVEALTALAEGRAADFTDLPPGW